MKKKDLQKLFEERQIKVKYYSLSGGLSEDKLCLNKTLFGWETYYVERGQKTNRKKFFSEEQACSYFYTWVIETLEN